MFKEDSYWKDIYPELIIVFLLTAILVYFMPVLAVSGVIACTIIIWCAKKRQQRRSARVAEYLDALTRNMEQATFYALRELPMAIAVFEGKGFLRWHNNICAEWFSFKEELATVDEVLPGLSLEKIADVYGEQLLTVDDRIYSVVYRNIQISDEEKDIAVLVYVTDVTEYENMKEKFDESRLAVAYLQFDNYNNVLKGLTDSQRGNIKAEVSKLVGVWIDEVDGVYKQYADDMYFVVMHRYALEKAIKQKFDILDRLREIKAGNKLPVTFSFGVSCDGENVVDIGQKAHSCLDMALGRGGDQAAVSFDGKILFFGGMTMAQEKNTRVAARSAAHVIRELMSNATTIFVSGHINEDFDSIGAALGMAKMAKILNKPVYIVNSDQGVSLIKFKELAQDYEEYKDILISNEEAVKMAEQGSLLILVDHHRPMLCAAPGLLNRVSNKIIIDHHRRAEDFIADATFSYHEPASSSTSELVTELLQYFADNVDFNRLEASILYAGIVVDSKNFAVQTGARTFEAAATLRLAGADPSMVRQLFSEDMELVKMRSKILANAEILPGEIGISCAALPADGKTSVAVAQAADTMLNMDGVKASFVLGQLGEEVIVSARSTGKVNVQLIMEELGGGGHQTVAGVKIKKAFIDDLKEQIIDLVRKQLEESEANENDIVARRQETR